MALASVGSRSAFGSGSARRIIQPKVAALTRLSPLEIRATALLAVSRRECDKLSPRLSGERSFAGHHIERLHRVQSSYRLPA